MGGLGTGEVLVLALLIGGVIWMLKASRRDGTSTASGPAPSVRDALPELRGEIDRLRDGLRMLAGEVDGLRSQVDDLRDPGRSTTPVALSGASDDFGFALPSANDTDAARFAPTDGASPPGAASDRDTLGDADPHPEVSVPASPAPALAEAYVQWCRERGPLASKRDLFTRYLRLDLSGATVELVYRDPAVTSAVQLTRRAGPASAEFWLVDVAGYYLLVPVPQAPSQFRDLAPAFSGAATPATLEHFEPAEIESDGGAFILTRAGAVG